MDSVRHSIGGLGNLMFKQAYLWTQMREGVIPDVYLQDEKYFKKYAGEIKQLFGANIGYLDTVAVHVRRGDYVHNRFYVDLFADGYYTRAMELFPNEFFTVFSDDPKWCKQQPIFSQCDFDDSKNEVDALNKMASCKGIIMANSSFSWWAAYLAPHAQKVVAPLKWHPDKVQRTVLLDKWIKV